MAATGRLAGAGTGADAADRRGGGARLTTVSAATDYGASAGQMITDALGGSTDNRPPPDLPLHRIISEQTVAGLIAAGADVKAREAG